jgi:hypothetical protein
MGPFDIMQHSEYGSLSPKLYGQPSRQIVEVANRRNHGSTQDWEYTSTLHKTLDISQRPGGRESWFTENLKVLPHDEALSATANPHVSPYQSPRRLFETETRPVAVWSAGEKVVPEVHRSKMNIRANKPCDLSHETVQRPQHLPSDGTWAAENFKKVEQGRPRRVPNDEWEGGAKTLPSAKVQPRRPVLGSWEVENHRTLGREANQKRTPYRFVVENTGWDSGHFKTFEADELAPSKYGPRRVIPYAMHNDWYLENRVIPDAEQHPHRKGYGPNHSIPFVFAGTGWDSGIKALPPQESHVKSPTRFRAQALSGRSDPLGWGAWELENRKTLPWEVAHSANALGETNKHIVLARAGDMDLLNRRMAAVHQIHRF